MAKLRVLVVEDSPTVRQRLIEAVTADPDLEVIASAGDGKTAIELCQSLRPDVVTLDMILPELNGVAVTEYIMAYCPTPIVIVSASTARGDLLKTYDALAAGAVEVFDKPSGLEPDDRWDKELTTLLKLVARIKVIRHPRARLAGYGRPVEPGPKTTGYRLAAIGASTGGPGAVVAILQGLPASFPLPILLVIHIAESFGTYFAEWLNSQTAMPVAFAKDGEPLPPLGCGQVLLAPPGRHLVVRSGRLWLSPEAERNSCRPSVDTLFESVAHEHGSRALGCLLTGMGKDGAAGLLAIRQAGGQTVAQDEATSVIFGMPREAIRLGAATHVLPLPRIAPWLHEAATSRETAS